MAKTKTTKTTKTKGAGSSGGTAGMTPQDKALQALYGTEGVNAGNALADKFLPSGALGRVSTEVPGQKEYLDMLKGGLGGYTSPEYQASREQMMRGVNSDFATAQSQLAKAQARGKVYGAAGAAQQANLITGADASKNNLEQDLMVKNIDEQQKRLYGYGQANDNANAQNLDREKTNLGQQDAEVAARVGAFTGAAGTALTKAQLAAAQKIQKEGLSKLS